MMPHGFVHTKHKGAGALRIVGYAKVCDCLSKGKERRKILMTAGVLSVCSPRRKRRAHPETLVPEFPLLFHHFRKWPSHFYCSARQQLTFSFRTFVVVFQNAVWSYSVGFYFFTLFLHVNPHRHSWNNEHARSTPLGVGGNSMVLSKNHSFWAVVLLIDRTVRLFFARGGGAGTVYSLIKRACCVGQTWWAGWSCDIGVSASCLLAYFC